MSFRATKQDRLPSCEQLHPCEAAEIYVYRRVLGRWGVLQRYCRRCNRLRYHARKPTAKHRRSPNWHIRPHGVIALNWKPPELTRE